MIDAIGADRTGVRLSPNGEIQGVNDSDPEPLFVAAASLLSDLGIAFLEIREPRGLDHPPVGPAMRRVFSGPFIVNAGYGADDAQAALDDGAADAVSFGKPFISNPDLPERFEQGLPIADVDFATLYGPETRGYADYPRAA